MLSYGYRSKCCYASIRLGRKKIKGTTLSTPIWICNKCGKRDAPLVEYTKDGASGSSQKKDIRRKFADEDGIEYDPLE